MWTLPYRATVASAASCNSALSETSALTPSTSAFVSFKPDIAFASASSSISQSMTFTPACDSVVAIPSPIPDAAPVTNAVRPAKSFMRFLSSVHSLYGQSRQSYVGLCSSSVVPRRQLGNDDSPLRDTPMSQLG